MRFKVVGNIEVNEHGFPYEVHELYAIHEKGDCVNYEPEVYVGTYRDEAAYRKAAEIYKKIKSNSDTFFDVM